MNQTVSRVQLMSDDKILPFPALDPMILDGPTAQDFFHAGLDPMILFSQTYAITRQARARESCKHGETSHCLARSSQ
jgi:hypothetical protein